MRSPNWKEEELKLALELYLSKDLTWLSKMSDVTPEVVSLSKLLNSLDLFDDSSKPEKFRSCGSIRMKLSNFKALDERYGKSSLSNIGSSDKAIWNRYHNKYDELYRDCCAIVKQHLPGTYSEVLTEYLDKFNNPEEAEISTDFMIFAKETYILAEQFRTKALSEENLQLSQRIVNTCFELMKSLEWCQSALENSESKKNEEVSNIKEHGGVNQVPINPQKIKIGKHVQDTMEKLISEGRVTHMMLMDLTSPSWSKEYLHLGHPFMIEIDSKKELKSQLRDANGYLRYWKRIYTINGVNYCICKEWFESGRKHFDKWVSTISKKYSFEMKPDQLISTLQFIKASDEKSISIKRDDLFQILSGVEAKEEILQKMIEIGLLCPFQGTERELVVEDYDLLFEMMDHPMNYC